MRSAEWALNQYDCCPNKKRKILDTDIQEECHVKAEHRHKGKVAM